MRNPKTTICVMAVVLCLAGSPVFGGIEFKDGGVHNIDYEITQAIGVDWQAPGMFTTVNWLEGASAGMGLNAYENSRVNICGGSIAWWSWIHDRSKVTMSGGSIGEELRAYDDSQVTVSGGSIGGQLLAYYSSQITVSGGSIGGDLHSYDSSRVTVSGGSIGKNLWADDSSQVTMCGGSIGGELRLETSGILTTLGSDFAVDGTPFGYGELTSITGGLDRDEPLRHLTGILASGDLLANDFRIGQSARIVLVPEPTTFLLLGLGGLMVSRRRNALRGVKRQI